MNKLIRVIENERREKVKIFSHDGNLFGILSVYIRNWLKKIVHLQYQILGIN